MGQQFNEDAIRRIRRSVKLTEQQPASRGVPDRRIPASYNMRPGILGFVTQAIQARGGDGPDCVLGEGAAKLVLLEGKTCKLASDEEFPVYNVTKTAVPAGAGVCVFHLVDGLLVVVVADCPPAVEEDTGTVGTGTGTTGTGTTGTGTTGTTGGTGVGTGATGGS
jgi:hypothetical protein